MAALTQSRDTKHREVSNIMSLPLAANAKPYAGGIAVVNAAGYCVPGSTSTTIKAAGRFEQDADNTGGANGAVSVRVRTGIFRFDNLGGDPVTIADRFNDCFIVDDQTVARTNGTSTRSVAGKVVDVDSAGVWVSINPIP